MSDERIFIGVRGIEAEVCRDISERQAKGIAKYKTTVADNPLSLREWLQHVYEEALDQAIYLKRAMQEIPVENADSIESRICQLEEIIYRQKERSVPGRSKS